MLLIHHFKIFLSSDFNKDFDPFVEQKEKAFHSSKVAMATLAHYVIQFTKSQPNSVEEAIKDREQLRLDFEMLFEVSDCLVIFDNFVFSWHLFN